MLKSARKIVALALVCSALCWADCHTLNLSVTFTKSYMVIGARGGLSPNIFFTTLSDSYGTRYVSLHRESENDSGRIIWALYSEKNGILDSLIVDKKQKIYKAVGLGEGGKNPPPLKKLKHSRNKVVSAPLSALDEVAKEIADIHKTATESDSNDIIFIVEPEDNKEAFFQKLQSYRPLIQAAKKAGFTYIALALLYQVDPSYGDLLKLFQDMYETVGLKIPSQEEIENHPMCSCTPNDNTEKPSIIKISPSFANILGSLNATPSTSSKKNAKQSLENEKFTKDVIDALEKIAELQTAANNRFKLPSKSDIVIEDKNRNVTEIQKMIQVHAPTLKHIYRATIYKTPNFAGTVTVKFSIAPNGEITNTFIVKSTTGSSEFDEKIKEAVSRWKLEPVNKGISTATITFTFSEPQ